MVHLFESKVSVYLVASLEQNRKSVYLGSTNIFYILRITLCAYAPAWTIGALSLELMIGVNA